MHHNIRWLCSIVCLATVMFGNSKILSPQKLEEEILKNNQYLAAIKEEINIQEALLLQDQVYINPELEMESGSGVDPESVVQLSQTIELGGKRKKRINLRTIELEAVRLQYENEKRKIIRLALDEYLNILFLQEKERIQQEQLKTTEKLVEVVTRKVEAGRLSSAEEARARIQLVRGKLEMQTLRREIKNAWSRLASYWGGSRNGYERAAGGLTDIFPLDSGIPAESLVSLNPEYQLKELEVKSSESALGLERAQVIPDVTVATGLKYTDLPGNTVNFGFSLPLPIFNRNKGNIQAAQGNIQKTEKELIALKIELLTQFDILRNEIDGISQEIELLEDEIIPDADKAFRTIAEGYLLGKFTFLEVVDARETWYDSRIQYITAAMEWHRLAYDFELLAGGNYHSIENIEEK